MLIRQAGNDLTHGFIILYLFVYFYLFFLFRSCIFKSFPTVPLARLLFMIAWLETLSRIKETRADKAKEVAGVSTFIFDRQFSARPLNVDVKCKR